MTLLITCPGCTASNRVPENRLSDQPKCGKCRQALFLGRPIDLDDRSLQAFVEKNQTPVLVDFWAPWCGPCRQMAPELEKAALLLEPRIRVAKLNTEDHQALAGSYAIRGIPTMILFAGGKELIRHSGAIPAQEIVRWAQSAST